MNAAILDREIAHEIAAILAREYDENPAYRKAADAYTSRRQPSALNDCQPGPDSSPLPVTGHPTPAALAPVAGAGLGGGR